MPLVKTQGSVLKKQLFVKRDSIYCQIVCTVSVLHFIHIHLSDYFSAGIFSSRGRIVSFDLRGDPFCMEGHLGSPYIDCKSLAGWWRCVSSRRTEAKHTAISLSDEVTNYPQSPLRKTGTVSRE